MDRIKGDSSSRSLAKFSRDTHEREIERNVLCGDLLCPQSLRDVHCRTEKFAFIQLAIGKGNFLEEETFDTLKRI